MAVTWAANPVALQAGWPQLSPDVYGDELILLWKIARAERNSLPPQVQKAEDQFDRNNLEAAIGLYQQSARENPNNWYMYYMIGRCQELLGRHDEALAATVTSKTTQETSTNSAFLGALYSARGKYQEGVQCFQRAITLDPGSAENYQGLTYACYRMGWYDEAIRAATVGLQKATGESADIYRTTLGELLARSYVAKGMYTEAFGLFGEAKRIGVIANKVPEGLKVVLVLKGFPAESAGILPGDVLVIFNGEPLAGIDGADFTKRMLGRAAFGSQSKVSFSRGGRLFNASVIVGVPPNLAALAQAARAADSQAATPQLPPTTDVAAQRPIIQIRRLETKPTVIAAGAPFDVEIEFAAGDPRVNVERISVEFSFSVLEGTTVLFARGPAIIEAPNGQARVRTEHLTASDKKGTYTFRVTIRYGDSAVEGSLDFKVQ
jgi:Flp pilus assembly protein TadD